VKETLRSSIQSLRPKQWIKNFLLFVAPFTAGFEITSQFNLVILGFFCFCAAASLGYVINDLSDIEIDRLHPIKTQRPFASGALSVFSGWVIIFLLCCFLLLCVIHLPGKFSAVLCVYILNTILYTKFLKYIPVLEMFTVAFGFILRLIAGAVVIDLEASAWLLIVGGFGSLFIVGAKRLAEFNQKDFREVRLVLKEYTSDFLESVITFSMAICTTGYALWAFSDLNNLFLYQLSLIPFTMVLFRYKWLSEVSNVEAPEDVFFRDRTLLMTGLLLFTLLSFAIY
jgi:decaprenyl-phosphate phosphoribosyltransferase